MSTDRCVPSRGAIQVAEQFEDVMQSGYLSQSTDTIHPGTRIHVLLYYTCARFLSDLYPVINDRA